MKTIEEIKHTPRLNVIYTGEDGGIADAYLLSSKRGSHPATVVFSNGGGWDHVSVSFSNRTPTWDEMSEVKRMFFHPDEVAVEYHPPEDQYVNNFAHCLHIWKPQGTELPAPPSWMVGASKGQSWREAVREGMESMKESLRKIMGPDFRQEFPWEATMDG